MAHDWVDSFTSDEIRDLRRISDLRGALALAVNWGLIALAMAAVALVPVVLLPVAVPLALFVIGARQLGMAVVMHEAAHRTLFRRRSWNDRAANWLAAYPVYVSLELYRPYHLQHHARTGTDEDPDLSLARGWPVSRASMRRKILRDLSGITGVKRLFAQTRFLIATARGSRRDRSEVLSFVGGGSATDARAALAGATLWQLSCWRSASPSGTPGSTCYGRAPGSPPTACACGSAASPSTRSPAIPPTRSSTRARCSPDPGSASSSPRTASTITSSTTCS